MRAHVQALGVVYLIYGVLLVCFGTVGLFLFGGLAALMGWQIPEDSIAAPIVDAMGGAIFAMCVAVAVPKFLAAYGLLRFRPWGRVLALVLCALGILEFPIGTAISGYGFWVLVSREGKAAFGIGGDYSSLPSADQPFSQ
ncbi:MAG: hypothetical protein R2762_05670 [Bryobacteraceae bacterium]